MLVIINSDAYLKSPKLIRSDAVNIVLIARPNKPTAKTKISLKYPAPSPIITPDKSILKAAIKLEIEMIIRVVPTP